MRARHRKEDVVSTHSFTSAMENRNTPKQKSETRRPRNLYKRTAIRTAFQTRFNSTRSDWRDKVDVAAVYRREFPLIKETARGWVLVCCPFHSDRHPSMGVNLHHGGFRCHACGVSGDLVDFIMRRHTVSFLQALQLMGVWQ